MNRATEEALFWAVILALLVGSVWLTLPTQRARGAEPAYCFSNKHGVAYPCREDPRQGVAWL